MRLAVTIARLFLGVVFLVFGLNGFLGFIPMEPPTGEAGAFMGALAGSGYLMPLVKAIEVVVGIALLANRFVPLMLIVLLPITVNIALYHTVLDPVMPGVLVAVLVFALNAFLIWAYRSYYAGMKTARAVPGIARA